MLRLRSSAGQVAAATRSATTSVSDTLASNVDSDDWEIGEDLPGGARRDMAHPPTTPTS